MVKRREGDVRVLKVLEEELEIRDESVGVNCLEESLRKLGN